HRRHAERLEGAMCNGELARRLVDLLDRPLGQAGLGRGACASMVGIVIGLRERHRGGAAEQGDEGGGNERVLHEGVSPGLGVLRRGRKSAPLCEAVTDGTLTPGLHFCQPTTSIVPTIPAWKWPGMRQANWNSPARLNSQTIAPRPPGATWAIHGSSCSISGKRCI